jgi:tetratricopeptide (TPR) repeat protein
MKRRITIGIALSVAALAAWAGARRLTAADMTARARERAAARQIEQGNRALQMLAYTRLLAIDSTSALALGQLAGLYVQRARETGSFENYITAESLARRSVALRENRNGRAYVLLASSLMAQHRFAEARQAAARAVELYPDVSSYRAALAEIEIELGDYDAARRDMGMVDVTTNLVANAPRLARWREISGDVTGARRLLWDARRELLAQRDAPAEQVAWFDLRVGELDLRAGKLDDAEAAFQHGLRVSPDDYRLLGAMARLDAVRHDWRAAIENGDRAIATVLDPATLGTVSDAWLALGDSGKAEEYAHTLEVAVTQQPGAYHRAWSLFLLDHDRRVDEVLQKAQHELAQRKDVYGYDVVAWALHHAGRDAEAREASAMALRVGTRDAMLYFHAGVIAAALGDSAAARASLRRALEIDSHWHPTAPDSARALLRALGDR